MKERENKTHVEESYPFFIWSTDIAEILSEEGIMI